MKEKSYSTIEKENKINFMTTLKRLLEEEYGAVYDVPEGFAVPVGTSPIDGKTMWVTVNATAKAIVTRPWGKTQREYYDGYEVANSYEVELKEKQEKTAERKKITQEKRERDKAKREN